MLESSRIKEKRHGFEEETSGNWTKGKSFDGDKRLVFKEHRRRLSKLWPCNSVEGVGLLPC